MRYKFYREHKYVSYALNELEREVAKADFTDPKQVQEINKQFGEVVQMLNGHAEYEDTCLHVLLKKKNSPVYEHAEEDHEHLEETFNNLQEMLTTLLSENEQQIELGYKFYLAFRKFVGENLLHLHEEETEILPELQRLYTDEELKMVERETYQKMTAEEMADMMKVLFPHMNPSDKEALLSDMKEAAPEKLNIALII